MGLFRWKKRVSIDVMANRMMREAHWAFHRFKEFNCVGRDIYDMDGEIPWTSYAINLGYFYGFLKIHLCSITSRTKADSIVSQSITSLENAIKNNPLSEHFGPLVRSTANKTSLKMESLATESESNPFPIMAKRYLDDLYRNLGVNPGSLHAEDAEKNMQSLYEAAARCVPKNIKITKSNK